MNSITRTTLVLALGLLVWPITATIAGTVDFDFETDPGWLEVGNRPSDGLGEDFGFSDTGNASGTAGEIGGLVARSGASACAYYGVDLGTILDLDQDMGLNFSSTHAADLFYGVNNGPWGGDTALLGFFNRNDRLVPHPANSVMGVQLSGSDLYTAMFFPGVANSETKFAEALAGGSQYTIRFQYNPSLGASGRLTVEFDGTVTTYDLTADQRASGAQYDTFGFLTLAADGGSGPVELYLDNVSVTMVPEPSAFVLLALGAICLTICRRFPTA